MAQTAQFTAQHDEVVAALTAIGNPERGKAVQRDRGSSLTHLGIGVPALRARVKQGFSFSRLPDDEVLAVWNALWGTSPYGDVLFAALEHYAPIVRRRVPPDLWPVVRGWIGRVDNWCHSDMLSTVYSRLLQARFDDVYPQLRVWNDDSDEWPRRISITSLLHYTGKHAIFLEPEQMLPMVANCVDDHRKYVELAVGWVLREVGHVYPAEVNEFLDAHAATMSSRAFSRAVERRDQQTREKLAAMRKARSTR
jgi:3-methyladenine DNA glycosylase AlkD